MSAGMVVTRMVRHTSVELQELVVIGIISHTSVALSGSTIDIDNDFINLKGQVSVFSRVAGRNPPCGKSMMNKYAILLYTAWI